MIHIAKKLGLVVGVVIWVFVCGEIVIRVISSFTLIYDIEMSRYARELIVPSPSLNLSHEHKKNTHAKLMGVEISLNSLGHRSSELKKPKPANEKRLHFIGSSIVLAWGVPVEKGFAEVTANLLNQNLSSTNGKKFIAINSGVANYNTAFEVALLKRQIEKTNPDQVIIQYHLNDAEKNPERGDNQFLRYSEFALFLYLQYRAISTVATKTLAEYYQSLYAEDNPNWLRTKAALGELKKITEARNIPLVAVLVPDLHDLRPEGPYPPLYALVEKAFSKVEIELINPLSALQKKFGKNPTAAWAHRDDPHPSAAAHGVIGQEIYIYLNKNNNF
jgi:hypothetical protein